MNQALEVYCTAKIVKIYFSHHSAKEHSPHRTCRALPHCDTATYSRTSRIIIWFFFNRLSWL